MSRFEVQPVTPDIFPAWIELAREVEPLFQGDMAENPEFHEKMEIAVVEKRGFAAIDLRGGEVAGIIVFSRKKNQISWLAVFKKYRGKGFGAALLEYAISELDSSKEIKVVTFREENNEGLPARRLYQKFGFQDLDTALIYNGQPRCLMIRLPKKD